ncbi:hypothetical protein [Limnochorda pilosa]|uniref:FlgD Ig-like domain-containing protein n=1 Tax=Limnochorda pilosa TaxID=1555112 RepID=A0A0K2SI60_LIMPI|nr:hypothetical protein [Limnochorda pilosa]BAS26702.1 hypothetical protein LIP_0845 [Limnochorda pilosa]
MASWATGRWTIPAPDVLERPGTLYVFDVGGRLVHRAEVPAGVSTHSWPLVNASGRPVAPGLYLYRVVLEDGITLSLGRMVVVPPGEP